MRDIFSDEVQAMRRDWQAVGHFLKTAMQEVATELGGEDLAIRVSELAASEEVLPDPEGLQLLETSCPGSAVLVFSRMVELAQELVQKNKTSL